MGKQVKEKNKSVTEEHNKITILSFVQALCNDGHFGKGVKNIPPNWRIIIHTTDNGFITKFYNLNENQEVVCLK
jgi:hypothetical protein